jgi:serine/threonine-protein kinase
MELPVPVGHILANKYRVDRFIAAGGMGVVAAGMHLELDQPVAIKFLCIENELSGEGVERFRREARAAAKIHSEHVVRVFDVGLLDAQVPYLVMELLEGNDLDDEIEARGALPVYEAVSYVLQAIDALAEAHAVGIVHRDLKPSNLYLARRSDGLRVIKVLDFGISKSLIKSTPSEMGLTKTSSLVGSPLFMSPEQMRSAKDVDARTDVWALGSILYYLVTAREPFDGDTLPQLCVSVMNEPHRPAREVVPSVPEALDQVIARCLEKERALRFDSLAELAEALVPFAPGFRAHAERASRLLGKRPRESFTPDQDPLRPSHVELAGALTQRIVEPHAAVEPSPAPRTSETQASWDQTARNAATKKRVPIIASLVVVAIAVIVFFSTRSTPSIAVPPNTVPEAAQEKAESARQSVAAATPELIAPADPIETQAKTSPAPSAVVEVVPKTPPSAASPKAGSAPRPRAASVARPVAPEKKPAKPEVDVTYFGGRR